MVEMLEGDPDPAVRGTAADELGYAGSFGAIEALLVGLDDPDPQVVIRVLEALESTADETLIPLLEPYLEHRDPTVREAVEAAIEYLE
jgi:HEAT repeat protein